MDYFWQNAKFVSRWKEATSKAPLRLSVNELLLISNFNPINFLLQLQLKTHLSPILTHLNPKLAHLSPELAHLSPKLAYLSPELAHLSPKLAYLSL